MSKSLFYTINELLIGSKKSLLKRIIFCIIFVSPIVFIMIINYNKISDESLENIFSQKKSLSTLAATVVYEKLYTIINFGILFASNQKFIEEIENKNWNKAVNRLQDVSKKFPYIERIVIYDKNVIIKADLPQAVPSVIGQSRADREWSRRFKKKWSTVVSDVYKRGAEPKINVVCVVIPIESTSYNLSIINSSENKENNVIGILQLQLNLDVFSEWINKTYIGEGGFIYLVDQHGHIIYHPKLNYKEQLIDFSNVPTVKKMMNGINGVDLNYNPVEKEERISAYVPIEEFGWGVVVTQPSRYALDARNKSLFQLVIIYGVVIVLFILLALFFIYIMMVNKKLKDLATHDYLTGLPNRVLMEDRIYNALIQAKRNNKMISVMSIDMDNFKEINDKYGHKAGDNVLKEISNRMKNAIRDSDTVSRYGGDEFVMLLTNIDNKEGLELSINRILAAIRQPFEYESFVLNTSISIGVTLSNSTGLSPNELIRKSDQALYVAKQKGKMCFVYSD